MIVQIMCPNVQTLGNLYPGDWKRVINTETVSPVNRLDCMERIRRFYKYNYVSR